MFTGKYQLGNAAQELRPPLNPQVDEMCQLILKKQRMKKRKRNFKTNNIIYSL